MIADICVSIRVAMSKVYSIIVVLEIYFESQTVEIAAVCCQSSRD